MPSKALFDALMSAGKRGNPAPTPQPQQSQQAPALPGAAPPASGSPLFQALMQHKPASDADIANAANAPRQGMDLSQLPAAGATPPPAAAALQQQMGKGASPGQSDSDPRLSGAEEWRKGYLKAFGQ